MYWVVLIVDLTGIQLHSPAGRSLLLAGSLFTIPLAFGLYYAVKPEQSVVAASALVCRLFGSNARIDFNGCGICERPGAALRHQPRQYILPYRSMGRFHKLRRVHLHHRINTFLLSFGNVRLYSAHIVVVGVMLFGSRMFACTAHLSARRSRQ